MTPKVQNRKAIVLRVKLFIFLADTIVYPINVNLDILYFIRFFSLFCIGVTVLLNPPQTDDIDVTMLFVSNFTEAVYPPNSYQQNDGEKAGITFSKSKDQAVNRYGLFLELTDAHILNCLRFYLCYSP